MSSAIRIGLVSDTHGLLRLEAVDALRGCDHLLHAGDIGTPDVLDALAALAPLHAIRGNVDTAPWSHAIPAKLTVEVAGLRIHLVHSLGDLAIDPVADGIDVVVSGHSHRPAIATRDGVLYVNPGSAGRRRFSLPVTVAELLVAGAREAAGERASTKPRIQPRIIEILPR